MLRFLLFDEQPLVRACIKRLLQDGVDMEVVAESSSSQECIKKLRVYKPGMVIMDIGAEDYSVFDIVLRMLMISLRSFTLVLRQSVLIDIEYLPNGAPGVLWHA